ncbi:TonB-dependent receptor plug domain-containing protein [Beggiatoa leptomitoformis]|uniref:TonB-dependent receptor plug domain-containing protein n=1 Tax=Beggiatoa leptomitoformis TaxID=288004 RepID=A0A2N9YI37_9GAMM|nr:TonB-dependent receptor [Beggiatoa leptomitoformis]ALG67560.1 TonB-dependent receptor plug domain-containing protein [Beggiatoa leptomitoformis]AUI70211.1 TonB-dependent receptor plug domain-containing protein [Beggiatoa leptomitoformis]
MFNRLPIVCAIGLIPHLVIADVKREAIELSLEELINLKVQVATKTPEKSLSETPSVVTIITAEEIANSGARDLMDVLRLVPGFNLGLDVNNIVGIGVRGSWAHEGKILLLIDGVEMTERRFGNNPLGNHYPVAQIKRIEIIRGAGSVLYGGFAEFGVINIISKTVEELRGVQATVTYGRMEEATARQTVNIMAGETIGAAKFTAMGYLGRGRRSDGLYVDSNGDSLSLANSNELNPAFLNLGIEYKQLSSRLLVDNYRTTNRDLFGTIEPLTWQNDFQTVAWQTRYTQSLTDKLTLDNRVTLSHQDTWNQRVADEYQTRATVDRLSINLNPHYIFNAQFAVSSGVELFYDRNIDHSTESRSFSNYYNTTAFLEGAWQAAWGNLTLGARYDKHSDFGADLSPRIAYTKQFDKKWHIKLLYSGAYRSPTVENGYLNPDIKSEKTNIFETEMGYVFNKDIALTVNLFKINTKDTIVYDVIPNTITQTYFNAEQSGSQGIETELRLVKSWGYATLNYSYAIPTDSVSTYKAIDQQTGEEKDLNLAFPAHKLTLNGHFKLSPTWSFNPSWLLFSHRYGYARVDELGTPILYESPTTLLTNVFFRYQPNDTKNWEVGMGVYDVFAENMELIQPYNGGHSPLPITSREFLVQLQYQF